MFRGRSTLVYLILALGMVCYLTFIDKKIPGTRDREESETQLFKFDQEDVTGLEIANVHGSFVFQKKNDHWEITSPVNTLADTATISEIIGELANAQPQNTIPLNGTDHANQNNLKEWGLAPAAEKAIIHLHDRSLELLVGRKVAINDSVFARTSEHHNSPVRVIPNTVKTALEKSLSDFRSRSVFDFETDKATRVATSVANTATTPAQECEVDFKGGKWTLQKPLVARATTSDVDNLLEKILALRVTDFVTDDPGNTAQYGLTSPAAVISVTIGDDDEGVLNIGTPVPGKPTQVYAQRLKSNAIFTLDQGAVAEIVKALPNVRDRHVLPFDPGLATAVSFSVTGKSVAKADLRREKDVWQVVGDSAGAADVGKITDLLTRLSQLMTTPVLKDSAPDLKPFGLDKPTGKISVTLPDDKNPLTLTLGKSENNLVYVRNSIEPFIYTLPDTTFTFLGNNLFYRDKRAINLVATKVRSVTITPQGKPSLVLDRSPGGTWSAENAKDRQIDATRADSQASILCDLQAQAWLGATLPAYGLDKPVLTFAIQTDLPTMTVLKIGALLPDGNHAAQVKGSPDVFEMSDADFGLLNSSTLQLIPGELNGTNTAPATNAPPSTNAAPVTNAASASAPEKSAAPEKKKKKKTSQ
jgi:hypothetical protein